jgi:N-acylglucosamine 2-epimerase
MKRRAFLHFAGLEAVLLGIPSGAREQQIVNPCDHATSRTEAYLAGMPLPELRQRLHEELFDVLLPFWDRHGIDHEYGGIMCSLDYDGTLISTEKNLWFMARAIWVYSFLYNHFGKDPGYLEVARKTRNFIFKHALQEDGWWAETLTREGTVLRPYSGDTEGMYFVVEGLQEYAAASGDGNSRDLAVKLFKRLFQQFNSPDFRYRGADFPYLWNSERAVRPQGLWFLNLNIATHLLERGYDSEIAAIADQALDAIMNKHYNPEIGLNTEMLYFDFSRPDEEANKSRFGHCVESLWMVMAEATRRQDGILWNTCAERILHHLDAGWDSIYGGLSQWANVGNPCYQWPVERPPGTLLELAFVGEYEYMKSLWGQNEVLVAALNIFERTRDARAARYFEMAFEVINEKFSQKSQGYPAGYVLFADRRITRQTHVGRQDNYHPLRQLMLNILTLDRMIQAH